MRPCHELVTVVLVALCCLSCHPTATPNTPTPSATVMATWWPTYTPTATATWTPTNSPTITATYTPIPQATVIDDGEGPGWRHLFAAEIDGPVDVLVDVVPHIPGGPLLAVALIDQGYLRIDAMGRAWVDVWRFGP